MTEEIIIDGVNVAGCGYLCTNQMGNNCLNHNQGFSMNCKNNNNCYYKQLKRLEQENERLKEDMAQAHKDWERQKNENYQLACRNAELKEENKALVEENEDMKKSFVSHSEFMDILENNPNIDWEATAKDNIYLANKYGKALKEIREILCAGRTFYEGYFDNENLSRVDKAIKKINEALK